MAQRQRQRLRALRNDPNLARFVVEGVTTGKQLGTGSYGAVEEVGRLGMEFASTQRGWGGPGPSLATKIDKGRFSKGNLSFQPFNQLRGRK